VRGEHGRSRNPASPEGIYLRTGYEGTKLATFFGEINERTRNLS
jgi:hypothetical protein